MQPHPCPRFRLRFAAYRRRFQTFVGPAAARGRAQPAGLARVTPRLRSRCAGMGMALRGAPRAAREASGGHIPALLSDWTSPLSAGFPNESLACSSPRSCAVCRSGACHAAAALEMRRHVDGLVRGGAARAARAAGGGERLPHHWFHSFSSLAPTLFGVLGARERPWLTSRSAWAIWRTSTAVRAWMIGSTHCACVSPAQRLCAHGWLAAQRAPWPTSSWTSCSMAAVQRRPSTLTWSSLAQLQLRQHSSWPPVFWFHCNVNTTTSDRELVTVMFADGYYDSHRR